MYMFSKYCSSALNFCKSWWARSVLCLLDMAWKNAISKHISTMCLCDIAVVTMDVTVVRYKERETAVLADYLMRMSYGPGHTTSVP